MKRWRRLILLIALLLGGASLNVLTAWMVAAFARVHATGAPDYIGPRLAWDLSRYPRLVPEQSIVWRGAGRDMACSLEVEPGEGDTLVGLTSTFVCGWPARSMRAAWWSPMVRGTATPPHSFRGVQVRLPDQTIAGSLAPYLEQRGYCKTTYGRLPTDPIPAGFAINTLFYTAILALPLSVFPIRRRLRTRRGRCPKCGYDLAGLADPAAPCPECGAAR